MATKYLKGECQQCGGHLEFPALAVGTVIDCPHCGQPTELLLAAPRTESAVPGKAIFWTAVAVLILGLGVIGSLAALKQAQKWAALQKHAAPSQASAGTTNSPSGTNVEMLDPVAQAGFRASAVRLQNTPDSSLVYAVGTVTNRAARQRFGVKVELDLFDAAGQKVGSAKDYQGVLEPKGEWHFKALVIESKAASAKIASVKEDQ
jgi:hypothetical protein